VGGLAIFSHQQARDAVKYGAHIFIWLDRYGDEELATILDKAVGLGLSFLEVSIGDDVHFDEERLRRRAVSLGLELVLSPGGLWPMHCDISLDSPQDRKAGLAWHKRAIERCAACGTQAASTGIRAASALARLHGPKKFVSLRASMSWPPTATSAACAWCWNL